MPAPTAEALMRSRYAAYALGLVDYVLATTHPDGPHFEVDRTRWAAEVAAFSAQTTFQGLEVVRTEDGPTPDEAFVTFRAHLAGAGRQTMLTERSRFLRVDGRWLYHSGTVVKEGPDGNM